jgi:hypothetical protein
MPGRLPPPPATYCLEFDPGISRSPYRLDSLANIDDLSAAVGSAGPLSAPFNPL